MTDRYFALTVVLKNNLRSDDAQPVIQAIKMIKGVLEVTPHVADLEFYSAVQTASLDLRKKLFEVLHPDLSKTMKDNDG